MEITDKLNREIDNLSQSGDNPAKLNLLKEFKISIKAIESYGVNSPDSKAYIDLAREDAKLLLTISENPEWFYELCVLTKDNSGIDFLEKEANNAAGFSSILYHRFYDAAKQLAGELGDLRKERELYLCQKLI